MKTCGKMSIAKFLMPKSSPEGCGCLIVYPCILSFVIVIFDPKSFEWTMFLIPASLWALCWIIHFSEKNKEGQQQKIEIDISRGVSIDRKTDIEIQKDSMKNASVSTQYSEAKKYNEPLIVRNFEDMSKITPCPPKGLDRNREPNAQSPAKDESSGEMDDPDSVIMREGGTSALQKKLDKYVKRGRTNVDVGRDYERYVGYLYETEADEKWHVVYNGALEGNKDSGRDLICSRTMDLRAEDQVHVVQAKCWSYPSNIQSNVIHQVYGSCKEYEKEIEKPCIPVIYAPGRLSDGAENAAKILGVIIKHAPICRDYPMIKCCRSKNGPRCFHLPFNKKYDKIKVAVSGGKYVKTVEEAHAWVLDGIPVKKPEKIGPPPRTILEIPRKIEPKADVVLETSIKPKENYEKVSIQCIKCGIKSLAPVRFAGRTIRCPHCKSQFGMTLSGSDDAMPEKESTKQTKETDPISSDEGLIELFPAHCPHCGHQKDAPVYFIGRSVLCPKCRIKFIMKAPEEQS